MKIKTTHSSLTANDWKVFSQRAEASEGGFPFVITRSGTPRSHQPEPKAHPKARVGTTTALMPLDWVTKA